MSEATHHQLTLLPILLLCWISLSGVAQTARGDEAKLAKWRKEMYYHYSKHHDQEFMATVDSIMTLAKALHNERDYYKAFGNRAIYTSSNISRGQGIELAKSIYKLAEQEKSRYGLYTANFVMGTIYTAMGQLEEASARYEDAVDILKHHYPDESISPVTLAICKIERALSHHDKVESCVEKVLSDPRATMQHRLSALSYRCMNLASMKAPAKEQDKAYAEREKLKAQYGHDDNFGYIIEFDHAILHDDFERAERVVETIPESQKTSKSLYLSKLYYAKEDYKTAYRYQSMYYRTLDSINNDQLKKSSLDIGIMLDKIQAENEAKSLRMANDRFRLDSIASVLRQQRLQEEALNMSLENEKMRLHEMAALRSNDSLMANYKDLQLKEYQSQLEAHEQEAHTRRVKWLAGGMLAAAAFIFIAIYANIRRLQLRQLKEAYDKLEETTAAKERIESELRIAREIQMAMVPHDFPSNKHLDIYAQMTPAKEVGGDLYDFVVIGDKLYFCVGDVSGKGVPAALFMSMSARLFRTLCKYSLSPAEIATSMNNELALNNENGMFVTMFIGLLNIKSGQLDFCNAGHNPPVLDGDFIDMEPNAPLGLWEGIDYEGQTLGDISGKQLFVYSDGLNEAENNAHDQYSDERLQDFIRSHHNESSHGLIDLLEQDIESHVDGAAPSDDLTMLCLRKN